MKDFPTFPTNPFAGSQQRVEDCEFIVFGVPYDLRSTGRRSIHSGPDAIRHASMDLETISVRFKVDYDLLRIGDIGDIVGMRLEKLLSEIEETVKKIVSLGAIPVLLGGEHTLSLASIRACNPSHLVVFDAHLDLRDRYLGEDLSPTTFLRRLLEERPSLKVVHIGARGFCQEELVYAEERGINIILSKEVVGKPRAWRLLEKYLEGAESLYVSVDLDVLDPAYMGEVANPEPEGLTPTDLFDLFKALRNKRVLGVDIVELSPTSLWHPSHSLAAKTVYELMASITRDEGARIHHTILGEKED